MRENRHVQVIIRIETDAPDDSITTHTKKALEARGFKVLGVHTRATP